ncbi:MAG: hypothetical protein ACTSU3_03865, partial [Candidatus Thorarchaeota archaeon]
MTEVDANRLKWRIIGIVQQFFEAHFSENASNLEEQFTCLYDSLLQQYESENPSEISRIHHLIR